MKAILTIQKMFQKRQFIISQMVIRGHSLGQGHITRMFHNRVNARQGKSVKEVFINFSLNQSLQIHI